MTEGHVFIAASLDGYIARADHGLDWLLQFRDGADDHGYAAFMAGMDGVIMGRGTFDVCRGFEPWPFDCPVVVMSRHLTAADVPEALRGRVEVSAEPPRRLMERLGWRKAYVDGGQVIRSFLAEALIAEITLTRAPVILGAGRPLFAEGPEIRLQHLATRSWPSGLVQSRYRVGA
jgi:dihydrofolate reductase